MSTAMTIRLGPELEERLNRLAQSTHRSKAILAAEAIRDFLELSEWQMQEIKNGIKEADEGDFATEQAVRKTLTRWGANAGYATTHVAT